MKFLSLFILILTASIGYGQRSTDEWIDESSRIHDEIDVNMPASFDGGDIGYSKFVKDNLEYPRQVLRMGIVGKVYVECVIEKDGKSNAIRVVKGIGGGADEESLRLVNTMKGWIPAKRNGITVRQRKLVEIVFERLDD